MKKLLLIAMPLFLTAAFSLPATVYSQVVTDTVSISESDIQNELEREGSVEISPALESDASIDKELSADVGSIADLIGNEVTEAEEDVDSLTDSSEDDSTETEAEPELAPEPAVPEPFASEPYTQSSLKDIEQHLEKSHELAAKSEQFAGRALAIIAGTTENRSFRRHCEFLVRAANHNIYAANTALLAFPRLLEISNRVCENSIRTLMKSFTGELINEPLAREVRLSELRDLLDNQAELARLLRNVSNHIIVFIQQAGLQSSRRHVQGRIPEFLRAWNQNVLALLEQQNSQLVVLLSQFENHYQFCLVNIDYFLAVSANAPGVMQGAQLGRILRSCNDFSFSLHNYREKFRVFADKFEKLVLDRHTGVEFLVGKESRHAARISEFTGKYPDRDRDDAVATMFTARQSLKNSFVLLDSMRNLAIRLAEGEISTAFSENSEISDEAFVILQNTLVRHLDSDNWPIKEFDAFLPGQKITED